MVWKTLVLRYFELSAVRVDAGLLRAGLWSVGSGRCLCPTHASCAHIVFRLLGIEQALRLQAALGVGTVDKECQGSQLRSEEEQTANRKLETLDNLTSAAHAVFLQAGRPATYSGEGAVFQTDDHRS